MTRSPYVDYDRVAERYREGRSLPVGVVGRWRDAVVPHIPPGPIAVADVGAGSGMFAAAWTEWADARAVGVEPSVAMVARRAAGVPYVRAVAEQLPLATGSVDVVWVSTALHHFGDQQRAAAEMARVLAPAGRVFVRTHLPERSALEWFDVFPGREKALARFPRLDDLRCLFEPSGFAVVHVEEVLEGLHTFGDSADWAEKMRLADSMLTALDDDEMTAGLAALRADPAHVARVDVSLVVFARDD